jgi:glycosyltransferase involved in cell wall biosynthesis
MNFNHLLSIPNDAYFVGSFQRDTEGFDLKSPKLEKGPDKLIHALIKLQAVYPNLHVILAGWRRQYIIARLEEAKIPYSYFERPTQQVLNRLYAMIDLYLVTARHEGGPQALLECALTNTPCVSTPVGIAEQVLPPSAINDNVTLAVPAVPNVTSINIPGFVNHDMRISHGGLDPYIKLLEDVTR